MSKQSEENRGGVDLADRPIAHAHFRRNTPFAQIRSTSYSGVFLVTIILIGVSITLLLTQEPVNLSGSRVRTSNVSDDNGTAKSSTAGSDVVDLNISKDEYLESPTVATVIKPGTFEATYYLADSSMMGSLSPSGKYTYEAETVKQFFRHSNEDLYQIRRLENGTVTGKPFHVRSYRRDSTETVLAFKWNPVNKNDFVFVNDYNLYYQMDPEKPKTAIDNKRRELSAAMVYQTGFVRGYDIQSDTLTFTSAGGGLGTMRLYKITQATMANRLSISSLSSVVSDCDYSSYEVSPDGRRAALSCIQ
ncbi:hypothetical protein Q1695_004188 [Nippostrongylus brasiliensis]|nr:hypothetical protein Q1695_004188 [Nippostrongylus brasiliensis]